MTSLRRAASSASTVIGFGTSERGDDHVTRACGAMDRDHGIDGRERVGREPSGAVRGLDRGPGGAGVSDRESEHGKAVGPKPKTPDIELGT